MKTKHSVNFIVVLLVSISLISMPVFAAGKSSDEESIVIGAGTEDTLRLESSLEISDIVEVTPHAARISDTLGDYGDESGDKNDFIIVDLDICNISKDTIDLCQLIKAELSYKDDYVFDLYAGEEIDEMNKLLLGTWEGLWDIEGFRLVTFEFTDINKNNELEGILEFSPYQYEGNYTSNYSGKYTISGSYDSNRLLWTFEPLEWIDNPDNRGMNYKWEVRLADSGILSGMTTENSPVYFKKTGGIDKPSELGVLEEVNYSLVFKCPNRVLQDIDNCSLYITIDDEKYEVPLQ